MHKSILIHRIQTYWIATILSAAIAFVLICEWSLWLTIPISLLGFLLLSWIGITIISMFDYNHRMAAKYGFRIENLPLYFEVFEQLEGMERQGIDTMGFIPPEIKDIDDWMRFCRWQIFESLKNNGR